MQTIELLEFTAAGNCRVDRVAGVIRGVKILGAKSGNGREYSIAAMRGAAPLYEGASVYVGHPDTRTPDSTRRVDDKIGWLSGVRVSGDALVGDLNLLQSDSRAAKILEAAEKNPSLFGLSHNADGRCVRRGGVNVVEEITRVRSVDIVVDPASTTGLFESRGAAPRQSLVAALRGEPAKQRLRLTEKITGKPDPDRVKKFVKALRTPY